MRNSAEYGFRIPEILFPAEDIDLYKWSVVACDQFTSQPDYWRSVEKKVGAAPSTLRIMLPEIYLEEEDVDDRIMRMKDTMEAYLKDGVLERLQPGVMLTERHIRGKIRKGILLAIDLECYDYKIENKPLIRATEQTVLSRIPPRVKIRNGAALELPHVMLMIDDEADEVIGPLHMERSSFEKLYEVDLMMDGGLVEGWFISSEKALDTMVAAFGKLAKRDGMLFCVGDGNHSLATAKTVWDQAKAEMSAEERAESPLRYALCEVINLRDRAVEFMPIHRVLFNVNPSTCAHYITERLNEKGREAKLIFGRWNASTKADDGAFVIPFQYKDGAGKIRIDSPSHPLALGEVQELFEEFVASHKGSSIDYIHGDEAFSELAKQYDCIGFYFDALEKAEFFDLIARCGVLPKKSFSLGEAEEKRYYMEGRALQNAPEYTEEEEQVENVE